MATRYTLTHPDKSTVRTDSESAKFRLLADGYSVRENKAASDKPETSNGKTADK